jgi:hypothetical protein
MEKEQQQEPPKQQQELWPAWKQQFIDAIEYDSKAAEDGEAERFAWHAGYVKAAWKLCRVKVRTRQQFADN